MSKGEASGEMPLFEGRSDVKRADVDSGDTHAVDNRTEYHPPTCEL